MHKWRTVLAVMWAGLAACGGTDDGGEVVEPLVPVERADFNAKAAEALCERYARCGLIEDRERCQEQQLSRGFVQQVGLGTRYDAALASGRIRYDADVAGQCVLALREGSCEDSPLSLPMLNRGIEYDLQCRFLQGQVADGEACQWSTECSDGAYCDVTTSSCGGVCKRGTVTHPDTAFDACPPGTALIPGTTLTGGRCLKAGGEGTSCGVRGGVLLGICDQGTWCETTTAPHGTCRRVSTEGETCDDYHGPRCGWSLYCRDGRCQKAQGEGAACTAPGTGRFGTLECRDELFCDGENGQPGTCRPRREAGAACRNAFECEDTMNCIGAQPMDGVWGTCQPAAREGESCTERLCGAFLTCSNTTKTCVATVRLGEPCADPDACYTSGVCVDGTCRPVGAPSCG
ncbi:hypothetical protein [Pyxidicoccus trucidator]|uniref:hypothetical protein n=1 Tax=Pyxidicoccus trucidator TaxID=2709662 RepID=UPI0019672444|nr:hypothetical protein [Pyxidicoccus trucidator]